MMKMRTDRFMHYAAHEKNQQTNGKCEENVSVCDMVWRGMDYRYDVYEVNKEVKEHGQSGNNEKEY